MKRRAPVLVATLAALLTACAVPQAPPPAALFADGLFGAPAAPVGTDTLFALTPAMRAYLKSPAFAQHLHARGPEQGLLDALYAKTDLMLDYDSSMTRTAAETYTARAGNCLSLVIMTSAFAQAMDLKVRYQGVEVEQTWRRDGDLYMTSSHVNIVLGHRARTSYDSSASQELLVDFLPTRDAARLRAHALTQDDIVMMFMNNRAVENLAQGRLNDAYWWARAAVAARAADSAAYNTLGVVYQRHGNLALAETTYRAALARTPDNVGTMRNLEAMLAAMGRHAEAQDLARRIERAEPVAPYDDFNRGMAAFKGGDYRAARTLFEREVQRAPYDDEFHFWLAQTLLRLGDAPAARDQLALAVDTSTRSDDRRRYAAKLTHLKQIAAGGMPP